MKSRSIELIGISGSGKSYTEEELRNATKSYFKIYNRREIVLKFAHKFINLTIKDRLTIFYFNLLNFNKKKQIKQLKIKQKSIKKKVIKSNITNFFRKNYIILCKNLFEIYCLKNRKFKQQLSVLIKNIKYLEKEIVLFWFYELCAARYIFEKTKDQNYIFLNDEGFIPKAFLFIYTKFNLRNKKKEIFRYLDTISYPDISLLLYKNKKDIFKTHKNRSKYNLQMYLEKNVLNDIFKINGDIEKYLSKKTRIIRIKNNHKILHKLIKIIKSNI